MCPLLVTIVQRVKNKKSPECVTYCLKWFLTTLLVILYSYPKTMYMYICCYVFVCSSCLCHVLYLIVDICEVSIFYDMYRDMVSPCLLGDEEKLIVTTQISY